MFPKLTERVWGDHADSDMLGGHHDPDHAVRVAQMALEIAESERTGLLAGAAGLVHNADRIIQHRLKLDNRRDAPREMVVNLIKYELDVEAKFYGIYGSENAALVLDAVLKHDGKNGDDDNPVLVTLMDADRLVNAEPDLVIRSAQLYQDLPPIDPVHFEKDPTANYRNPKSVLRDIMETLEWLTPDTPFYVRLPKSQKIAAERREFFDRFIEELVACRAVNGFLPYPPELAALREKFAATATK